jgi:hypothetical protein
VSEALLARRTARRETLRERDTVSSPVGEGSTRCLELNKVDAHCVAGRALKLKGPKITKLTSRKNQHGMSDARQVAVRHHLIDVRWRNVALVLGVDHNAFDAGAAEEAVEDQLAASRWFVVTTKAPVGDGYFRFGVQA